jgi:hypothetical protein
MLISDHAGRIADSSLRKYSSMPPQAGILDLSDLMRLFSNGPSECVMARRVGLAALKQLRHD